MADWDKKKIVIIFVIVVVLSGLSIFFATPSHNNSEELLPVEGNLKQNDKEPTVVVYVSGAVHKPGVYEVRPNLRAEDVLKVAGGVTEEADLSKVNLAKKCKDGTQINVPSLRKAKVKGGASGSKSTSQYSGVSRSGTDEAKSPKININTATQAELETLPGVGSATALKIMDYRSAHSFSSIEEIMKVSGIGTAKFAKMKDHLEV